MAQAVIAKRARGMIWREQLRLMKISIVKIQCMARRRIAMWKLYDLRLSAQHGMAAVEIQKYYEAGGGVDVGSWRSFESAF